MNMKRSKVFPLIELTGLKVLAVALAASTTAIAVGVYCVANRGKCKHCCKARKEQHVAHLQQDVGKKEVVGKRSPAFVCEN
jgi:hypothetical protein